MCSLHESGSIYRAQSIQMESVSRVRRRGERKDTPTIRCDTIRHLSPRRSSTTKSSTHSSQPAAGWSQCVSCFTILFRYCSNRQSLISRNSSAPQTLSRENLTKVGVELHPASSRCENREPKKPGWRLRLRAAATAVQSTRILIRVWGDMLRSA